MRRIIVAALAAVFGVAVNAAPVKVIFDTDMCGDYDDAGALACLHALADAGECEILATIVHTRNSVSAAMCEIINAYYGRPDIPVGCVKGMGHEPKKFDEGRYGVTVKKYAHWVKHRNSNDAPDAAEVYRKVLAAQPDKSVVICSVGFLTNLRKLVETDRDLVARKVKLWVAMACAYPNGRECNSMVDHESSRIAIEGWPTPIVFSDFQYGMDCFAGRALAESKLEGNPVADVFRGNLPSREQVAKDTGRHLRECNGMEGHAAWDQTAVLAAVRGADSYFNVHRGTYRMVGNRGDNEWLPGAEKGPHLRITEKVNKAEVGKVIDELMMRAPTKMRAAPVKVIFDTDMCGGPGDAGALAILHAMADAGECEILATVSSTRGTMSVAMCEIINAYYGRPEVPVGSVRNIGISLEEEGGCRRIFESTVNKYSKWVKHLNSDDAPDAAEVYRKVLAAQPDKSVVICSVGFLTNMRKLVELDRDLVARKVKHWVCMACNYPSGREHNSMRDAESSRIALEKWPTPIIFSDFQYGMDCYVGYKLSEMKIDDNPVADLFRSNFPTRQQVAADPYKHMLGWNGVTGHAAWDDTAVLVAVRGVDSYFNGHRGRYRMMGNQGNDEWQPDDENGPHLRITEKVNKIEVGKVIDELLCRPPTRK